ncbi:MAG: CoA-binding protein [candidate division Zixibacteria bacterium]|nr:CoA-binding protein [candidate division Zixibacteria bacterium]
MTTPEQNKWSNPDQEKIKQVLTESKTIAVVGLSAKAERPSYGVANYLMSQGYDVIPVNPMEKEILGKKSYPDLTSIGTKIDIVDIFRKGEATPPIVEEAIKIGATCIWLQEGVVSEESYRIASNAGVTIIMDRCLLKEHQRAGE